MQMSRLQTFLKIAVLKGTALLLNLIIQVALGRLLGPAGVGAFQTFLTWSAIGAELSSRGYPTHALRFFASTGEGNLKKRYLSNAWIKLLTGCVVTSLPLLLFTWLLGISAAIALSIGAGILSMTFMRFAAESLKGTSRVKTAVLLENIPAPFAMLFAILLSIYGYLGSSSVTFVAFYLIGLVLAATIANRLIATGSRSISNSDKALAIDSSELNAMWGSALLSIIYIQFPFLLLPMFAGAEQTGLFAIAFKLISLVATFLILLASIYGPLFARAWESAEIKEMGRLLWCSQLTSIAMYAPVMILLLANSEIVLSLFGAEFVDAESFLWILALGQLINAATGLPGVFLNMTGAAKQELYCLAISLGVGMLLAWPIGTHLGAEGIAWLYTGIVVTKNLLSLAIARRQLRVASQVFPTCGVST